MSKIFIFIFLLLFVMTEISEVFNSSFNLKMSDEITEEEDNYYSPEPKTTEEEDHDEIPQTLKHGIHLQLQYDQILKEGELALNRLKDYANLRTELKNWIAHKQALPENDCTPFIQEYEKQEDLPPLDSNFTIPLRPYLPEAQDILPP